MVMQITYAVAHAQCFRPKEEAGDRKFKAMQESFDKTTDMYVAIRYQQKAAPLEMNLVSG